MLPETKLDIMLARHASLEAELSRPLGADVYVKLTRELAEIAPVVDKVKAYRNAVGDIADLDAIIADPATEPDMRAVAVEEKSLVEARRIALEQEIRLTTGFIEPHFFAGFSGGPKMVAPGLAHLDTVLELHSAARIGHPHATWGVTLGNPVHDAVRGIAEQVEVAFNLDVTLNQDHRITGVFAGDLSKSHAAGCAFARKTAMVPVRQPYDVVVSTNSGYPLDQNLYQTVKGMSAAAQIVKDAGAIVMASECSDGLPEHGRYKELLREAAGPAEFLGWLERPGPAHHDQWQVQVQAQIQRRAQVMVYAGGLTAAQVRGAWLEPVADVSACVADLLTAAGPEARLAVLPQGPQTIPYLTPSG